METSASFPAGLGGQAGGGERGGLSRRPGADIYIYIYIVIYLFIVCVCVCVFPLVAYVYCPSACDRRVLQDLELGTCYLFCRRSWELFRYNAKAEAGIGGLLRREWAGASSIWCVAGPRLRSWDCLRAARLLRWGASHGHCSLPTLRPSTVNEGYLNEPDDYRV